MFYFIRNSSLQVEDAKQIKPPLFFFLHIFSFFNSLFQKAVTTEKHIPSNQCLTLLVFWQFYDEFFIKFSGLWDILSENISSFSTYIKFHFKNSAGLLGNYR